MAIDTSMMPGWESPGSFSLRSAAAASSIGSTFNSAFQAAANRKQNQEQFDARKQSAIDAEANRIIKVMGLGEQLSKILGPTEKLPGPTGEGMGSDTGSNTPTWEKRSAQDNFKNLLGAVAENPYWMADKDLKTVVEGVLKSTGELAQIETKAKEAQEALTNNTQTRQIATGSIASLRAQMAALHPKAVTSELVSALASGQVPTQETWNMLKDAEIQSIELKALDKANEPKSYAPSDVMKTRNELKQAEEEGDVEGAKYLRAKLDKLVPSSTYKAKVQAAEAALAKANAMPVTSGKMDRKGNPDTAKDAEALHAKKVARAKATAELEYWKSLEEKPAQSLTPAEKAAKANALAKEHPDWTKEQILKQLGQ